MQGEDLMEALIRIQKELKVPKERYNKFGDFYYRNAEDILKAVKPLLVSETLITTTQIILIGDAVYFGVTSTLRRGEHSAEASAWAREEKTRPKRGPGQLSGSAESYAKKYSLGNLFMLDDGVDADHPIPPQDNGGPADWTPPPKRESAPASDRYVPSGTQIEPTPWDGQGEPPPSDPPPSETPPPAPPQGQIPAPTPDQRKWLGMLWDYYVSQSQGRIQAKDPKTTQKMCQLCQLHMRRYPGSMSDVEQLKQWIKVEELCV